MEVPSLSEWKKLSLKEKRRVVKNCSPYDEGLDTILKFIDQEFKIKYSSIDSIKFRGVGDRFGEVVISVETPFVFDKRKLPEMFEGVRVYRITPEIPPNFERYKNYIWAPENWKDFVEGNFDKIKSQLGNNQMEKDEVYRALIGMPINKWIDICREKGLTKRYAGNSPKK